MLDYFFPAACVSCGREGTSLCGCTSLAAYRMDPAGRCPVCFCRQTAGRCLKCSNQKIYFDAHRSVFEYRGVVRDLIHRWKFQNERRAFAQISRNLVDLLRQTGADRVGVIASDRRFRSFLHSEDLLSAAGEADIPCGIDLVKKRIGKKGKQSDRNQAGRYLAVRGSLECIQDLSPVEHYVVLDDVFTTGATANEAARTARLAGAKRVSVLTAAMREDLELL